MGSLISLPLHLGTALRPETTGVNHFVESDAAGKRVMRCLSINSQSDEGGQPQHDNGRLQRIDHVASKNLSLVDPEALIEYPCGNLI